MTINDHLFYYRLLTANWIIPKSAFRNPNLLESQVPCDHEVLDFRSPFRNLEQPRIT